MRPTLLLTLLLGAYWLAPSPICAQGTLSPNRIITSDILGYALQYRVYTPPGYTDLADLPAIYVVDGQWYIDSGEMPQLMDDLIAQGAMQPAIAVFVDNRDPNNLSDNRRNRQFFCNPRYARFFEDELIPEIDRTYRTAMDRSARVTVGLSFGGLNAACFGLLAHDTFAGIAMQSPAMHPVPALLQAYQDSTTLPLNLFLSSGTFNDNEARTRRFRNLLQAKGYDLTYREVPFAHNWRNWKPLLDDILLHYFPATE